MERQCNIPKVCYISLHWGRQSTGTGCPGGHRVSIWRHWKPTWTCSRVTRSIWPCPGKGVGPDDLPTLISNLIVNDFTTFSCPCSCLVQIITLLWAQGEPGKFSHICIKICILSHTLKIKRYLLKLLPSLTNWNLQKVSTNIFSTCFH